MATFDLVAELPIEIEGYELEDRDRTYGDFTRPSTIIHLRGGGHEGTGEDVVYDVLDHVAHRDRGPVHDLSAPRQLGELCDLIAQLDLFQGAPPERDFSRHYRRWAFESAALDLALRQSGLPLHEALGRDPKPVNFVCSTRLGSFGDDDRGSTTEPLRKRLAKYPTLHFKLDPENDWDAELISEIKELAPVDVLDLKGHYKGTPVDVDTDPELYRAVSEAIPDAWLEDPDLNDETRAVLEPHAERITWDAPVHSVEDVENLPWPPRCINIKPSRFGSVRRLFEAYDYCAAHDIGPYGGGQWELGPGRGQIQYLAALFHPDTPNDVAPGGYNAREPQPGLPASPLEPALAPVGFRWAG